MTTQHPHSRRPGPIIDPEKCSGCGLCLPVCPDQTLSLLHGKVIVSGERCLACGHCLAVCPTQAISVPSLEHNLLFQTFGADNQYLPPGQGDTAQLVRLMLSRRSCRNYKNRALDPQLLEDLARIGTTAPSGTNSQGWTFTILPSRPAVEALGTLVGAYFARLNRLAANPLLRNLLRLLGKPALANYYHRYQQTIAQGLREWEEQGHDRLFHGAPGVIIVGSHPGASCPKEDALLATQNILLAAHTMGLGSCLIGFAVAAMARNTKIQQALGIPAAEEIHAVIALGYPAEPYQRLTGRKPLTPRYFSA
ncbi:nitroreductase family protein [Thiovibrio frasassiensis]|uniref:Nitroreductase family protein n=1 Tax=Thiovibrio frasassiensis TaxID=2984131 RepID=A0A9X4MEV2_9BACT|nr:nitroreductase family protein [Thiovibrio frasassiensis]MDG4475001.1 nitroreductase family protein [Thiovibrio frasassiensis]